MASWHSWHLSKKIILLPLWHTLSQSHTLVLSIARTLDRSLSRTLDRSLSHALDRSLSRTLALPHSCSFACSLSRAHARSLSRALACSPPRTLKVSLSCMSVYPILVPGMFTDLHLLELDLGTQKSVARPNKRAAALRQARVGLALKGRRVASIEQDSEVVSGAPSRFR